MSAEDVGKKRKRTRAEADNCSSTTCDPAVEREVELNEKKKKKSKRERNAEIETVEMSTTAPSPSESVRSSCAPSPVEGEGSERGATAAPPAPAEKKKKKKKKEKKADPEPAEAAAPAAPAGAPSSSAQQGTVGDEFRKAHEIRISFPTNPDAADESDPKDKELQRSKASEHKLSLRLPQFAPTTSFEHAPFCDGVKKLLKNSFETPSAIQSQVWGIARHGHDVIAVAKTGSGKTLAFLLPCLEQIQMRRLGNVGDSCVQMLILAPTRELAVQIDADAKKYASAAMGSCTKSKSSSSGSNYTVTIYGGVPKSAQIKELLNVHSTPLLVTATPGRLVDLFGCENGKIADKFRKIRHLVLDEADRMLEMGFEPQMKEILQVLPTYDQARQTLLFSATWPKAMRKLLGNLKLNYKNLVQVDVGGSTDGANKNEPAANKAVEQVFFALHDDEKDNKLWRLLDELKESDKTIVFANTKRRIAKLSSDVFASGYTCSYLSGDQSQAERERSLKDFTTSKTKLLFGTDVCARGLDIKDVTHVINYDMARDVEGYIHRIGRTGRAGASGKSITFVNSDYDVGCAPALVKIALEAGQTVPDWLAKMGKTAGAPGGKKVDKLWKY
eukprot:g8857.t1